MLNVRVFFLENFMIDSLLLLAVGHVLKCRQSYGRIIAGGIVGSLLTCLVIIIPLPAAAKLILFHVIVNSLMILFFRRFPIDKRRCIGYPVSSEIEYRHTMKGICLFCLHPRERLSGAKPYGASWRLTPECELFEWALLDANKSGTAENLCLRLFDRKRGGAFFILSAYLGKDRVSHEKL